MNLDSYININKRNSSNNHKVTKKRSKSCQYKTLQQTNLSEIIHKIDDENTFKFIIKQCLVVNTSHLQLHSSNLNQYTQKNSPPNTIQIKSINQQDLRIRFHSLITFQRNHCAVFNDLQRRSTTFATLNHLFENLINNAKPVKPVIRSHSFKKEQNFKLINYLEERDRKTNMLYISIKTTNYLWSKNLYILTNKLITLSNNYKVILNAYFKKNIHQKSIYNIRNNIVFFSFIFTHFSIFQLFNLRLQQYKYLLMYLQQEIGDSYYIIENEFIPIIEIYNRKQNTCQELLFFMIIIEQLFKLKKVQLSDQYYDFYNKFKSFIQYSQQQLKQQNIPQKNDQIQSLIFNQHTHSLQPSIQAISEASESIDPRSMTEILKHQWLSSINQIVITKTQSVIDIYQEILNSSAIQTDSLNSHTNVIHQIYQMNVKLCPYKTICYKQRMRSNSQYSTIIRTQLYPQVKQQNNSHYQQSQIDQQISKQNYLQPNIQKSAISQSISSSSLLKYNNYLQQQNKLNVLIDFTHTSERYSQKYKSIRKKQNTKNIIKFECFKQNALTITIPSTISIYSEKYDSQASLIASIVGLQPYSKSIKSSQTLVLCTDSETVTHSQINDLEECINQHKEDNKLPFLNIIENYIKNDSYITNHKNISDQYHRLRIVDQILKINDLNSQRSVIANKTKIQSFIPSKKNHWLRIVDQNYLKQPKGVVFSTTSVAVCDSEFQTNISRIQFESNNNHDQINQFNQIIQKKIHNSDKSNSWSIIEQDRDHRLRIVDHFSQINVQKE